MTAPASDVEVDVADTARWPPKRIDEAAELKQRQRTSAPRDAQRGLGLADDGAWSSGPSTPSMSGDGSACLARRRRHPGTEERHADAER